MKGEKFNNPDVFEFPQSGFIGGIVNAVLVSILINSGLAWLVSPWLQDTLIHSLDVPANIEIILVIVFFMITLVAVLGVSTRVFFNAHIAWLRAQIKPRNFPTENLSITQQTVLEEIRHTSPYLNLMYHQLEGALQDTEGCVLALIAHSNQVSLVARHQSELIEDAIRAAAQYKNIVNMLTQPAELAIAEIIGNDTSPDLKNGIQDVTLAESSKLDDILSDLNISNTQVITKLAETFSFLQFQDVLRQRVEQTLSSIRDLDEHFKALTICTENNAWDGHITPTLKELMESHLDQYVMSSQHDVHSALTGSQSSTDNDSPLIELF